MAKLSGPMLDRIDMHVHLQRVAIADMQKQSNEESSELVRGRVGKCRERQLSTRGVLNSRMSVTQIDKYCDLDESLANFLTNVCDRLAMSARAYHRILKLARTIADLDNQSNIDKKHLAEAIAYRSLDRR